MPVLADIWAGNILYWNDSAIAQLNPGFPLPGEPIALIFANETRASISDVFANALSDFNPEFRLGLGSNYSFASKWVPRGVNPLRSVAVAPGEQQLGYVLVHRTQFKFGHVFSPDVDFLLVKSAGRSVQHDLHHDRVRGHGQPYLCADEEQCWYVGRLQPDC